MIARNNADMILANVSSYLAITYFVYHLTQKHNTRHNYTNFLTFLITPDLAKSTAVLTLSSNVGDLAVFIAPRKWGYESEELLPKRPVLLTHSYSSRTSSSDLP